MSKPKNPLDFRSGFSTYFVLIAFPNTPEAEAAEIKLDDGPEGTMVEGGVLIVNDALEKFIAPTRFFITHFNHDFTWSSSENDTTVSGGSMIIGDTSGGEFLTFLRKRVIERLGVSLENITFALRIFWNPSGEEEGNIIKSEKFYFSISEISHKIAGHRHFYDCSMESLFNAKAHSTNYNRVYTMTITHRDGELHDEIPKPNPAGGGIKTRSEEDSEKKQERNDRILKSKPMVNLKDAYDAFEKELNESTKAHQGQYQKWQKTIREDHVNKLNIPQQQKDIPIVYQIRLADDYNSYNIDNRNLPFEQPEQKQESQGVRAIPTKYGERIDTIIDRIMGYSSQVGLDAKNSTSPKDYKICKVWRKVSDNIFYDIVIEPYTVPVNYSDSPNTGPGEGAKKPLQFFFQTLSDEEEPDDVIMFDGVLHRSDTLRVMEEVQDKPAARLSYGADREEISSEREPETDFFQTGFSGHRPKIANHKVLGVEYPVELAETIQRQYATQNVQQSTIELTIPGNPNLLSDLFRSPNTVVGRSAGTAHYYKRPEVYPMYAKAIIQFSESEESRSRFYHENWMHIYKIETIIKDGSFFQKLTLLRTDEVI